MAPLPERGTPEYDERMRQVQRRLHDGPSTLRRATVVTFLAALPILAAGWLISSVLRSDCGCNAMVRGLALALAAVLLIVPGRMLYVVARRRMQTGAWTLRATARERAELHAKWTDPNSRSLKILKTANKWDVYWDSIMALLCASIVWDYLKPAHNPWTFVRGLGFAFWSSMLVSYAWGLYRRAERKSEHVHRQPTGRVRRGLS